MGYKSRGDQDDEDFVDESEYPDESDMDKEEDEYPDAMPCPHCGKMIYEESEWCAHCGQYLSKEDAPVGKRTWIVLIALAAMIIGMLVLRS